MAFFSSGATSSRRSDFALFVIAIARRHERLRDGRGRGGRAGHFDAYRVVQELPREPLNFGRHRRGEEQGLPREGHELADALDVGNEAHVEHAVGLVDDEKLDAGEEELAALDMIEQAAGSRDEHIGAARDLQVLVAEGDAADQQRDRELVVDAVFDESFLDLRRELTRRLDDERARHARPGAARLQHRQHRQGEGCRLAGAGLGDAEDIAPLEDVGDGLGLDRGGDGVAGLLDRAAYGVG